MADSVFWLAPAPVIALVFIAAITLAIAIYVWRHRDAPGAGYLVVAMLAAAEWLLAYTFELTLPDRGARIFWAQMQYVGIAATPLAWLAFALSYTGRTRWLKPRILGLLALEPVTTVILAFSNDWHSLIWRHYEFYQQDLVFLARVEYGPWFWLHVACSYVFLAVGTVLVIRAVLRTARVFRWQTVSLLAGALLPWLGNALYVSGRNPAPGLDLTPFAFALSGAFVAASLFRYHLFDLVPVARHAVVERMADGTVVLDHQDRVVDLNPAAQQILAVAAPAAIGKPIAEIIQGRRSWLALLNEAQGAQREITVDGQRGVRHYELNISPLASRRGGPSGRLLVLHDVSERKRIEEALEERTVELQARNEELDAFAHTVAHDLKTPVHLVCGFAEFLAENLNELSPREVGESLERIMHTGHKMDNIIQELMLLASVRNEEVEISPLDMAAIVREAQVRLAQMSQEACAVIVLPAQWPAARGYAPWVEEVWINYLSNAITYGGHPPRVELGASAEASGMIRFWISDNGQGLTPEAQASLFTPFTRLNQARATGHGLGLSIVRRIVERLGGQVGVASQVGQGSVFSFTLPAA